MSGEMAASETLAWFAPQVLAAVEARAFVGVLLCLGTPQRSRFCNKIPACVMLEKSRSATSHCELVMQALIAAAKVMAPG